MELLSESEGPWGRGDGVPTCPGKPTDVCCYTVSLFKSRSFKSGVSEDSKSLFETCFTILLDQITAALKENPQNAPEFPICSARLLVHLPFARAHYVLNEKLQAQDRNSRICEWDVCSPVRFSHH